METVGAQLKRLLMRGKEEAVAVAADPVTLSEPIVVPGAVVTASEPEPEPAPVFVRSVCVCRQCGATLAGGSVTFCNLECQRLYRAAWSEAGRQGV